MIYSSNKSRDQKKHKKTICFIARASINGSVEAVINLNKSLYKHFAEAFDEIFFLDVSKVFTTALKYGGLTNTNAYDLLPSKFKVVCPGSLSEFKRFLRSYNMIVISSFSESW